MFLKHNQLVKHNLEFNQDKEIIQFVRCLKEYKIQYQNISFKFRARRFMLMEKMDKEHQKIRKKLDPTNPEDLLEYI